MVSLKNKLKQFRKKSIGGDNYKYDSKKKKYFKRTTYRLIIREVKASQINVFLRFKLKDKPNRWHPYWRLDSEGYKTHNFSKVM